MDKTSFKIFITALLISLIIFALVFVYALNTKDDDQINVKYVTNASMFLTVENCVNKYIGLISTSNTEALYNVIDEEYKKANEITIYNVLANNIGLSDNSYSFVAEKMLEDGNTRYKYYVKGKLYEEEYGNEYFVGDVLDYEIIVILDVENHTYSIIPSEVGEYFDAL